MNFKEVLENLLNGKFAARSTWNDNSYIQSDYSDGKLNIVRFMPSISLYHFSNDIYFCNEWLVGDEETEVSFAEAIIEMTKGRIVRLKTWNSNNYLSIKDKQLVCHSYISVPNNLDLDDFLATDWIILN